MATPFLGEIRIFGFNFAPRGNALCNGQILSIAQNTALFSLLGTTYGGDGKVTFALPNLQSRVPIHFGTGQGLSTYDLGQVGGTESVTLLQTQIPAHSHLVNVNNASVSQARPANNFLGKAAANNFETTGGATMNPGVISPTGGSQPHENIQPYLVLNFCIALQGIFPSRN